MSPFTNISKCHPKLEQQNGAFLPSGDTQRFTSTPNQATDRTTDIFDYRHETMKRADHLHISSTKGNESSNRGIKLLRVSGGSFKTLLTAFLQAVPNSLI